MTVRAGIPVVIATQGGLPVAQVAASLGVGVVGTVRTDAAASGMPIVIVAQGGMPMVLYAESGTEYSSGGGGDDGSGTVPIIV